MKSCHGRTSKTNVHSSLAKKLRGVSWYPSAEPAEHLGAKAGEADVWKRFMEEIPMRKSESGHIRGSPVATALVLSMTLKYPDGNGMVMPVPATIII
jgi:hypothetical protein